MIIITIIVVLLLQLLRQLWKLYNHLPAKLRSQNSPEIPASELVSKAIEFIALLRKVLALDFDPLEFSETNDGNSPDSSKDKEEECVDTRSENSSLAETALVSPLPQSPPPPTPLSPLPFNEHDNLKKEQRKGKFCRFCFSEDCRSKSRSSHFRQQETNAANHSTTFRNHRDEKELDVCKVLKALCWL